MSKRPLNVGMTVRLPPIAAATRDGPAMFRTESSTVHHIEYRIEQVVRLDGGDTLYKIKSEAEPLDRIVDETDLKRQP
jgi:hypothetical protein